MDMFLYTFIMYWYSVHAICDTSQRQLTPTRNMLRYSLFLFEHVKSHCSVSVWPVIHFFQFYLSSHWGGGDWYKKTNKQTKKPLQFPHYYSAFKVSTLTSNSLFHFNSNVLEYRVSPIENVLLPKHRAHQTLYWVCSTFMYFALLIMDFMCNCNGG